MEVLNLILKVISFVLAVLVSYKTVFMIVGLFGRKKVYPDTAIQKKYTFVIPARNEEQVLPKLLQSIALLDYPRELVRVIVISDNSTDRTTEVARSEGALVYERFDETKKRKGYALEYLFEKLKAEGKLLDTDAYIIVDADNLLRRDFLTEINKGFVQNGQVVCAYRSCKNFNTNFISASYGIHFFRSTVVLHRPRAKLNIGTHLAGTGICISSTLLQDGWHYTALTEDTELSSDLVCRGIKVGFVEDAILYDEQPTKFSIAFRQRVRWAKGRLTVFFKSFPKVFVSIFKNHSFTSYDFFWYLFPYGLATFFISLIYPLTSFIICIITKEPYPVLSTLKTMGITLLTSYVSNFLLGAAVVLREHRKINCGFMRTLLYIFMWPWFDIVDIIITLFALFKRKVVWKPIPHEDTREINSLKK